MSLDDMLNAAMRQPGMPRYALVRGAESGDQLRARLPLGWAITATLRHKDGGAAWVVMGFDLSGGVPQFDRLAGGGVTVQELDFTHPLLRKVQAARPDTDDEEEEEDDDADDGV